MSLTTSLRLSLASIPRHPPHPSPLLRTRTRTRPFTTHPHHLKTAPPLPPRPTLPESSTFKKYLKGSGPGGQKINKTSSAVQLTHLPTGIVVKSQRTRSRTQNETIARRILAEKVEVLVKGGEARTVKKQELRSRRKRSGEKKRRRKYRELERGREGEEEEEGLLGEGDARDGRGEIEAGESGRGLWAEMETDAGRTPVQIHEGRLSRLVGDQTR